MPSIDLNADLGEGDTNDAALLAIVTSCNVACGGHAGDAGSIAATLGLAIANGVAVGAHPAYPDREGFGRRRRFVTGNALYESLSLQAETIADIAANMGARITHLKPHGALYNDAAVDAALADVVARVAAEMPGSVSLVGPPGSELGHSADRSGLRFLAEGFVDRAYTADGRLVPRAEPGAVHDSLARITEQAVMLAVERCARALTGESVPVAADTLCIHGDTPGADVAARAVRDALETAGVTISAPSH